MKKINLMILWSITVIIAQLCSSKVLINAETLPQRYDKAINTSDEAVQPQVNKQPNPPDQEKVDKQVVINSDRTPLESEKLTTGQHPAIFFENPNFNFGSVFKGQKVEHIYKFENRGSDVLNINNVKSSCGCTAVILTDKIVPPGKTGEIKTTFNTGSFRGKVTKSISVISNDPESPNYNLTITGEIKEEISATPVNINFGSIYIGDKTDKTVKIKSVSESNLSIKKITSTKQFVSASIAEKDNDGYTIKAELEGNHEIGRFSGVIFLETDSPRQLKVTIPFFGEIVGDLTTYPNKIHYGLITSGSEITQKLFVKINKDDILVLGTKVSPDFISIKIVESNAKNNPQFLVEIKLHKAATIGKLNGLLELHTNSKIQPVIKIPISGEIKKT